MDIRSVAAAYTSRPVSQVAKGGKKAAPEKKAAPKQEQVELSATSQSMQKVQDAVNSAPDVRIKMVEEIKNKIRQNAYPIESNLYKAMQNMVDKKIL